MRTSTPTQSTLTVTRPVLTEEERRNRVIRRLLRQHESEWFETATGTPVMVVHVSQFHKDPEHPLYGTCTWMSELHKLHSIRETLVLLGY
jgi:hypothetical protein